MKVKFFIAALCFFGLLNVLKEDVLNCGGDVLVVIEDVHFRQIDVKPGETVCVENKTDDPALVIDAGDVGQLQYTLPAHTFLSLKAQTSYESRVITIDVVK